MRRVKLCFPKNFPVFVSSPYFLPWLWMSFEPAKVIVFWCVFLVFYMLHHLCLASLCSFRFFLIFLINQNSERSTFCYFTLLSSVYVPGKHAISTWSTSMVSLFTVNSCCKFYSLKSRRKKTKPPRYSISRSFGIRNSVCEDDQFLCNGNRVDGFCWLG